MVYDCSNGSATQVGGRTMNTNISFCESNSTLSFLSDGAISFWKQGELPEIWPLEGEDLAFSPGGNAFLTIYKGRLYIIQKEQMKTKTIEMKRIAEKILSVYLSIEKDQSCWENSYSGEYIRRKIALYRKLSSLK